jgi:hypothetical protein
VDEAHPLDDLEVLAPAVAMRDHPSCTVDAASATDVGHGKRLALGAGPIGEAVAVLDDAGRLLAMYERLEDGLAKPVVVVAPAEPGSAPGRAHG